MGGFRHRKSPDREKVADLILSVLDRESDKKILEGALREAFLWGDRPLLEKLLPWVKEGIDSAASGKRMLMSALVDLDAPASGYPEQMDGMQRFRWVLEKKPDLSPSPGLKHAQALEFLPFALHRFSTASSARERALFGAAIDGLMQAQAPLWFEDSPQSFRAARDIAKSENPEWIVYLVNNFPRERLAEVAEQVKEPKAQALLVEELMDLDLSMEAKNTARPSSRF